jgi:hypothetical protein
MMDNRGVVSILFAGMLPGLLAIGSASINAEYSFVQGIKVRGCAQAAALALVLTQREHMAWEMAEANGCRLQDISIGNAPPAVTATGTLTATITYQPILWPTPWQVSATATASLPPGPGQLAFITSIK